MIQHPKQSLRTHSKIINQTKNISEKRSISIIFSLFSHHFRISISSLYDIHIWIIIIWIHHFPPSFFLARTSLQRSPRWTPRGSRAASRGRSIRAIPRRPRWGSQKPPDKTRVCDGFWWFLRAYFPWLWCFTCFRWNSQIWMVVLQCSGI